MGNLEKKKNEEVEGEETKKSIDKMHVAFEDVKNTFDAGTDDAQW